MYRFSEWQVMAVIQILTFLDSRFRLQCHDSITDCFAVTTDPFCELVSSVLLPAQVVGVGYIPCLECSGVVMLPAQGVGVGYAPCPKCRS